MPLIHQQITDHYRRLIKSGELKPGEYLPSQAKLMELFECSITPVRRALVTLEHEGLVEGLPGRGTRVKAQA